MPEEYLLGDRAMYLFAFNNVRDAFSPDGYFSDAGAKTTLKALASFDPDGQARAKIDLAKTYTNEFVKKAHAKLDKKYQVSRVEHAAGARAGGHPLHLRRRRTAARYTAVRDTTLRVGAGEFVSVVGPTGCGKSTLLNVAAGPARSPRRARCAVFGEPLVRASTARPATCSRPRR